MKVKYKTIWRNDWQRWQSKEYTLSLPTRLYRTLSARVFFIMLSIGVIK